MPFQQIPFFNYKYEHEVRVPRKISSNIPPDCECSTLQNQTVLNNNTCKKKNKNNLSSSQSYMGYLQKRCKTYRQNTFDFEIANAYTQPLGSTECAPHTKPQPPCRHCDFNFPCKRITYKPNNISFQRQGAVSGRVRMMRIRYNQKQCKHNSSATTYCTQNNRIGKHCPP